jgi:hypothetical protein
MLTNDFDPQHHENIKDLKFLEEMWLCKLGEVSFPAWRIYTVLFLAERLDKDVKSFLLALWWMDRRKYPHQV